MKLFFLFGEVIYRDAFNPTDVHLTQFCYFTVSSNVFIALGPIDTAYWVNNTARCVGRNCQDGECSKEDLREAAAEIAPATPPPAKRR
jgi:hypothetical protein